MNEGVRVGLLALLGLLLFVGSRCWRWWTTRTCLLRSLHHAGAQRMDVLLLYVSPEDREYHRKRLVELLHDGMVSVDMDPHHRDSLDSDDVVFTATPKGRAHIETVDR